MQKRIFKTMFQKRKKVQLKKDSTWKDIAAYTGLISVFGLGLYVSKVWYQNMTHSSIIEHEVLRQPAPNQKLHLKHMYLQQYNAALKQVDPNAKDQDTLPSELIQQIQAMQDQSPALVVAKIEQYVRDLADALRRAASD